MANLRQEMLAKEIVMAKISEKTVSKGELLERVGYATSTAKGRPSEIYESKGVREEIKKIEKSMKEALNDAGVDEAFIAERIKYLANHEDHKAVTNGVDFALKVGTGGGYAPQKTQSLNVSVELSGELGKYDAIRQKYEEELKQQLIGE